MTQTSKRGSDVMVKMRFDENNDARCGNCGRLLFKRQNDNELSGIEIKCHSCKELNCSDDDMLKTDEEREYEFIMSCFKTF